MTYTGKNRNGTYTCPNCDNKKALDIVYNTLDLDHLQIMKDLVNDSELTHDQIGQIAFNLFYEEVEE